jgi:hypothetical protein
LLSLLIIIDITCMIYFIYFINVFVKRGTSCTNLFPIQQYTQYINKVKSKFKFKFFIAAIYSKGLSIIKG